MTEQLNLWKAALQVAFDQTCSVGRPKDWKLIKDALDSVNAALTQPAQPAEGGEAIVLSADVREYLQEGIDNATQCEEADVDYAFAEGLAQLLGPLYTAPPASQEQAQQPSGGEVVAWTESKPKKPGVYGWRGSPASYDMVHVHTRPTEHSPGGQLNGSCLSGKGFYHGCAITSWGGEWIGPLDTLTLATPKPEPMTWQPIATAPKDGTAILVSGGCFIFCVEWNNEFDWWAVDDNKLGPFRLRGAAPTHWMPLPPAPITKEQA